MTRSLIAVLVVAMAMAAETKPTPTQAEQDEIWRKAMEESRQVGAARPKPTAPRSQPPPAAAPAQPAAAPPAAAAPAETGSHCGVGLMLAIVAIGIGVYWSKRDRGQFVEGWRSETTLHFDTPLRTPMGSLVREVGVCIDIYFEHGQGEFQITSARLTRSGRLRNETFNTYDPFGGEAWQSKDGAISSADLLDLAKAELARPDGHLKSAMQAVVKRRSKA